MRKTLLALLALTFVFLSASAYPRKIQVTAYDVALRVYPNEDSKLRSPLFDWGDVLTCVGENGGYYKVSVNGGTYYFPKRYSEPFNGSFKPQPPRHPIKTDVFISKDYTQVIIIDADERGVVLRARPDEESKLIGEGNPHFFSSEVLPYIAENHYYFKVRYNDDNYYIPKKYGVAK